MEATHKTIQLKFVKKTAATPPLPKDWYTYEQNIDYKQIITILMKQKNKPMFMFILSELVRLPTAKRLTSNELFYFYFLIVDEYN